MRRPDSKFHRGSSATPRLRDRCDSGSAAAWCVWVYTASTRRRVVMHMRGGRYDRAAFRNAVGCALAISLDRHRGRAHQLVGLAGVREDMGASEHCGGNQRGGQISERSHGREPFMSGQNGRTLSAKAPPGALTNARCSSRPIVAASLKTHGGGRASAFCFGSYSAATVSCARRTVERAVPTHKRLASSSTAAKVRISSG